MSEAKTETKLPPAPPEKEVEVKVAFVPPTCPYTGKPCLYIPPCNLPAMTGRTYCQDWVAFVRADAIAKQTRG